MLKQCKNHNTLHFTKTLPFIKKLYHILSEPKFNEAIFWASDETSIVIDLRKIQYLMSHILPHYYKHNNYRSFVRQLNIYGFQKQKNYMSQIQYYEVYFNKHFYKGNQNNLKLIRRKTKSENTLELIQNKQTNIIPFQSGLFNCLELNSVNFLIQSEKLEFSHRSRRQMLQYWCQNIRNKCLILEEKCVNLYEQNNLIQSQNIFLINNLKQMDARNSKIFEQLVDLYRILLETQQDNITDKVSMEFVNQTHKKNKLKSLLIKLFHSNKYNEFFTLFRKMTFPQLAKDSSENVDALDFIKQQFKPQISLRQSSQERQIGISAQRSLHKQ